MNVYDFDNTIYQGDSSVDLYRFCLRRNPGILRFLPAQLSAALDYYLKLKAKRTPEGKTAFKQVVYRYFTAVPDMEQTVSDFWDSHIDRIKAWYSAQQQPEDVIISASPEFLVAPACERLGIRYCMASRVNSFTGAYTGLNCHGEEKVRRFRERFSTESVEEFYSDSLSDAPMAKLAKQAFLVKGTQCLPWPQKPCSHST